MSVIGFFSFYPVLGQLQIPTQFSTFTSEEYGIQLEYPSEWEIFGDRVPGDYVTDIAVFIPPSEIQFKEYDSYKDVYKIDNRAVVLLDYSYLSPKINLNFALDNTINIYSEDAQGFKKFKLIESTTNSKLDSKKAYELIFQLQRKGDTFKYLDIGTIIDNNQVLKLNFKAPVEEFDLLLPTFKHMIDSFKIGEFENNNTNSRSTTETQINQEAIQSIFENDET